MGSVVLGVKFYHEPVARTVYVNGAHVVMAHDAIDLTRTSQDPHAKHT